jgi:hypothetical protein
MRRPSRRGQIHGGACQTTHCCWTGDDSRLATLRLAQKASRTNLARLVSPSVEAVVLRPRSHLRESWL